MSPLGVLGLVVSRFEQAGVPYVVAGSFASSAYGVPRSTMDADVVGDLKPDQVTEFFELFAMTSTSTQGK